MLSNSEEKYFTELVENIRDSRKRGELWGGERTIFQDFVSHYLPLKPGYLPLKPGSSNILKSIVRDIVKEDEDLQNELIEMIDEEMLITLVETLKKMKSNGDFNDPETKSRILYNIKINEISEISESSSFDYLKFTVENFCESDKDLSEDLIEIIDEREASRNSSEAKHVELPTSTSGLSEVDKNDITEHMNHIVGTVINSVKRGQLPKLSKFEKIFSGKYFADFTDQQGVMRFIESKRENFKERIQSEITSETLKRTLIAIIDNNEEDLQKLKPQLEFLTCVEGAIASYNNGISGNIFHFSVAQKLLMEAMNVFSMPKYSSYKDIIPEDLKNNEEFKALVYNIDSKILRECFIAFLDEDARSSITMAQHGLLGCLSDAAMLLLDIYRWEDKEGRSNIKTDSEIEFEKNNLRKLKSIFSEDESLKDDIGKISHCAFKFLSFIKTFRELSQDDQELLKESREMLKIIDSVDEIYISKDRGMLIKEALTKIVYGSQEEFEKYKLDLENQDKDLSEVFDRFTEGIKNLSKENELTRENLKKNFDNLVKDLRGKDLSDERKSKHLGGIIQRAIQKILEFIFGKSPDEKIKKGFEDLCNGAVAIVKDGTTRDDAKIDATIDKLIDNISKKTKSFVKSSENEKVQQNRPKEDNDKQVTDIPVPAKRTKSLKQIIENHTNSNISSFVKSSENEKVQQNRPKEDNDKQVTDIPVPLKRIDESHEEKSEFNSTKAGNPSKPLVSNVGPFSNKVQTNGLPVPAKRTKSLKQIIDNRPTSKSSWTQRENNNKDNEFKSR